MTSMTIEERVELLEVRLRHVLATLASAPIDCTTIADGNGGAFDGPDQFIGTGLAHEAQVLLEQWDEEDARGDAAEGTLP